MNKNVLLVLAAVIIIGLGLFMFMGSDDGVEEASQTVPSTVVETDEVPQTEVSEESEASVVTITYTDSGFEPANQTVAVGTTVRFVNNSSRSMWVASDDHPTHTDLPEFDDGRGVGPGETYEFTFEEVGDWGYHDHLNSRAEGVITVR